MAVSQTHPHIGLVINPTAGLGKGEHAGKQVIREFARHNINFTDLSGTSAIDAHAKARAASLNRLDALVVVGGDGMVNLGVNATAKTSTPLGIIAVGSGNDFARAINLPINDVRASIEVIAQALEAGSITAYDAGVVEPHLQELSPARVLRAKSPQDVRHSQSTRRWFAGTLSLGFDAAVNLQANTYSWPKGHLKYLRAVVSCLNKYKPYGYSITIEGETIEKTGTLAAISNAPYFGGGIPIAPHASLTDGKLNLMLADALSVPQIMRIFPKLYSGKHLQEPAVSTREVTEVIIGPSDRAQFPPVAMADGEVIGPVPVRITVDPGVLRVLT